MFTIPTYILQVVWECVGNQCPGLMAYDLVALGLCGMLQATSHNWFGVLLLHGVTVECFNWMLTVYIACLLKI